eukprot:TRINITY_DN6516_c0_g1_i11.p1 TRINITY_DN6516_c0_g1~~TRINITY_DN6516_c0_g1_i11.p1  ORF type:complete len:415 (+),score=82.79 TRINITY_DN6516_c0_g1_i11:101-1345(+)
MNYYQFFVNQKSIYEEKCESSVIDNLLADMLFKPPRVESFHVDCKVTGKRVCKCTMVEESLLPKNDALSEYLAWSYEGLEDDTYVKLAERRQFYKEKLQFIQEPQDLYVIRRLHVGDEPEKYLRKKEEHAKRLENEIEKAESVKDEKEKEKDKEKKDEKMSVTSEQMEQTPSKRGPKKARDLVNRRKKLERVRKVKQKIEENDHSCYWPNCNKSDADSNEEILKCTRCDKDFHASCCEPSLIAVMARRFPWLCNECKLCVFCKSPKEENKLIICDLCDRAFHIHCLEPKMDSVPEIDWFCDDCRRCNVCKTALFDFEELAADRDKILPFLLNNQKIVCDQCRPKEENTNPKKSVEKISSQQGKFLCQNSLLYPTQLSWSLEHYFLVFMVHRNLVCRMRITACHLKVYILSLIHI